MLLFSMNRRYAIVTVVIAALYGAAIESSARQRPVPRGFSFPEGSQTVQIEANVGALSGIVTDPNGGPLPDVLVERVTPTWTNRLTAVFTDSRGRFHLA